MLAAEPPFPVETPPVDASPDAPPLAPGAPGLELQPALVAQYDAKSTNSADARAVGMAILFRICRSCCSLLGRRTSFRSRQIRSMENAIVS